MSSLLLKSSAGTGEVLSVTQDRAGWNTISLRLVRLESGQGHVVSQPEEELALVMLGGRASIAAAGQRWPAFGGRRDVFSGMPHTLYLPVGTDRVEIEAASENCEI